MTGPFRYPDYNATQGTESPLARSEWDTFLGRRKELVDAIAGRLQLGAAIGDQAHADRVANQTELDRGIAAQRLAPPNGMELNELLGAASYYGIVGAENIPPDRLKTIVEARRMATREQQTPTDQRGVMRRLGDSALEGAAALGLGATSTLVRAATKIPFIGDAFQRTQFAAQTQQWLGSINEGVTASLPEGESMGYRVARGAGSMLAYTLPASAAYRVIGAASGMPMLANVGSRLSPLMRGAMTEVGAAWLMEGGGDDSIGDRAKNVAMAAGFGIGFRALEGALPALFARVKSAFEMRGSIPADQSGVGRGWQPDEVQFAHPLLGAGEGRGSGTSGAAGGLPSGGPGGSPLPMNRQLPSGQPRLEGPGIPADQSGMPLGPNEVPADFEIIPRNQPTFQDLGNRGNLLGSPDRNLIERLLQERGVIRDDARRIAESDPLTGLGNRGAQGRAMGSADADPGQSWAVFDAERFKAINDIYGHGAGDSALVGFARAIDQASAELGIPSRGFRPGGDEFSAIVPTNVAERFTRRVEELSQQTFGPNNEHATRLVGHYGSEFAQTDLDLTNLRRVQKAGQPATERGAPLMASQLTKQATIMESPVVSQVAAEAAIDESTVVRAALASNPGQVSVIRDVGDVAKTIRNTVAAQVEGKLMPHQFRVVKRGDAIDVMVSDGLPISNKRVSQYQQFGMFEGQLATTAHGADVRIVNPAGDYATVQSVYGGEKYFVPRELLMPGRATVSGEEMISSRSAEGTYKAFRAFAEARMSEEGSRAGLPGFDWTGEEVSSQLPRLMDEFFRVRGMKPGEAAAMQSFFEHQRVQEFQSLAPAEMNAARAVNNELNVAVVRSYPMNSRIPVEDIAATKAFRYVQTPGSSSGLLMDQLSDLTVPVANEEAAHEFLRNFNREVPDFTPLSDVPVEAMPHHPMAANPGDNLPPVQRGGEDAHTAGATRELSRVETLAAGSGNAAPAQPVAQPPASPPPPPPPGATGAAPSPGPFPTLPPFTQPSLGAQFAAVNREAPAKLHDVLAQLDGAWMRYGTPFRFLALKIEQGLGEIGVTQGKLWQHYNDVVTGISVMHNESRPWHEEWSDIMGQFSRRKRRDGTVMRVQEIVDFNEKMAAMQAAGYSPREIAAQGRIGDFFDRLHQQAGISNYIFGYTPRVRQRQAMGMRDAYADREGILPESVSFFAEFARTGNLQMRQQDMGVLGTTWIRAWQFQKHVGPAYEKMVQAWQDPRVPSSIRGVVTDWLEVARTGFNPGYDIMVQGIRRTLNKVGVPVTDGEVAGVWNTVFSNMYRASLGGRPDAIFRDSVQPLLSGARIGMQPIAEAYTTFFRGGAARDAMWERAVKGGWVEKGQVRSVNAEAFTQPVQNDAGASLFDPAMTERRETWARFGDVLHDMLPPSWRNGIQGSKYDPLFFYTKLGEFNRLISGDGGWRVATAAIEKFQRYRPQIPQIPFEVADQTPAIMGQYEAQSRQAMDRLMRESKAAVFPKPIQQEFQRRIGANDYDGAANLIANEAANLQFRYGMKENPIGVRQAGNVGRMGMMYGTFTQQYIAYMREGLSKEIPAAERAAFLARYGAVTGALGIAGAYTGWNFSQWMWHNSLTFSGGPLAQSGIRAFNAATGAVNTMLGGSPNPQQQDAMRSFTGGSPIAGAVGAVFPYASTVQTAANYEQALGNMNPLESVARTTLTGDPSNRTDFQQTFRSMETVTPEVVDKAAGGDQQARMLFSPGELQVIDSMRNAPPPARWQAFSGFRARNWNQQPTATQQRPTAAPIPGAGAMY